MPVGALKKLRMNVEITGQNVMPIITSRLGASSSHAVRASCCRSESGALDTGGFSSAMAWASDLRAIESYEGARITRMLVNALEIRRAVRVIRTQSFATYLAS